MPLLNTGGKQRGCKPGDEHVTGAQPLAADDQLRVLAVLLALLLVSRRLQRFCLGPHGLKAEDFIFYIR